MLRILIYREQKLLFTKYVFDILNVSTSVSVLLVVTVSYPKISVVERPAVAKYMFNYMLLTALPTIKSHKLYVREK